MLSKTSTIVALLAVMTVLQLRIDDPEFFWGNLLEKVGCAVKTEQGYAFQHWIPLCVGVRMALERQDAVLLYRVGHSDYSKMEKAQYWALEKPTTEYYGQRYGIPPENIQEINFVMVGVLKKGVPFALVTRKAPSVGGHKGGGLEVVVPGGAVEVLAIERNPPIPRQIIASAE